MLESLATRYPEKTFYLGQVFNDATNSYKLVWFLAILSLLRRPNIDSLTSIEILTEIATTAWHPVCLYRLSLGRQDKLKAAVLDIQKDSGLPRNASSAEVRKFVNASNRAQASLESFRRYVPTRFLAPWFTEKLRGQKDSQRASQIEMLAKESQKTPFACPYWFDGDLVRLNKSWCAFILDNFALVQAFAERHFAQYLQRRNPNVPGILNKLQAPTERQLTTARQFWRWVRADFQKAGDGDLFLDIYSGRPLEGTFAIDHFLPWSFVAHDLLWNLAPVEAKTNSKKGDVLPDLELYLPRLVKLHLGAIESVRKRPKLLEDYTDCFKMDADGLLGLSENALASRYREIILPQAQIAQNQGFQSGWRLHSEAVFVRAEHELVPDHPRDRAAGLSEEEAAYNQVVIELLPKESDRTTSSGYVPFYSLAIAAGGFLAGDSPEPEGWVNAVRHGFSKRLSEGMFVTRVIDESMAPTIMNGSYCVFRSPVEGPRQGRIVLVEKRDLTDPETGGGYTVKRYKSAKSATEDGWKHESIQLIPDNPDRKRFPVLEFSAEDDSELRVVAEFVQMLSSPTQFV